MNHFSSNKRSNIKALSKYYFLIPLGIILYMTGIRLLLILSYNIDLDGAEFTSIHYVQKLLMGKALYGNPESFPFAVAIYTPLYLYILYAICKIMSVDPVHAVYSIYVGSRLLSFLFVMMSVFYIDLFVKKQTRNGLLRWSFIATYLMLLTQHIYVVRTDSMKIAFFIMFLYYYIDYFYYSLKLWKLIIAIICALISIAAKQDALIYIALVQCIHFIFHRKLSSFITVLISGCCYALLFVGMSYYFGPYFNVSIFQFNAQVLSNYQKSYNIWVVLFNTVRLSPFYILFFYNTLKSRNWKDAYLIKIISVIGILAALSSSFSMLRPGSYLNYTYELIVICMFCLILFVTSLQEIPKQLITLFTIYIAGVLITGYVSRTYSYTPSREKIFKKEYADYYSMREQLLPLLKNNECIFSLNLGVSLFIADKNVIYGQEYHLDRMVFANLGLKSNSRLLYNSSKVYDEYFMNGKVNYIIAKENKENKILMETFYPKYRKEKQIGEFNLYAYNTNNY